MVWVLFLLNTLMYAGTVYCVLVMLEEMGKRNKDTRARRADLAIRWAVGFSLLQLFSNIAFTG